MVWKASEREYAEYEEKKKAGAGQAGQRSQNIKMNGRPVPDNRGVPANQQAQRDIRNKARQEQDTFEKRHPTAHKIVRAVVGAGHAAKEAGNRYVSSREENQKTLARVGRQEHEEFSDSWVSQPVWGSSLPKRKSKNPSLRSGGSNDYYGISLTNSLTGASYGGGLGGGLGMWGSSLPKKS